jgi:general stress protein YciG
MQVNVNKRDGMFPYTHERKVGARARARAREREREDEAGRVGGRETKPGG